MAFDWDDDIELKLSYRSISPRIIERLFDNQPQFFRNKRKAGATWMMIGKDPVSGRTLKVGIRWKDRRRGILRVVTAFDFDA